MKQSLRLLLTSTALALVCAAPSAAQETTGVPGSPEATTTITGKQLPPPDPTFGGVIEEKSSESKPWWPPRVVPPKGAPNVLLIMTDDQGFGAPSTFGGVIPTPAMDQRRRASESLHPHASRSPRPATAPNELVSRLLF
jgi:hypothetical protein